MLNQHDHDRAARAVMSGVSKKKVRAFLIERGLPSAEAEAVYTRMAAFRAEARKAAAVEDFTKGIVALAIGGGVTWWTYSATAPGGRYLIMTGLLVVGCVYVVRGLARRFGIG